MFGRSSAAIVVHQPTPPAMEPADPATMGQQLPPNHPPITQGGSQHSFARDDSPPALAWVAPPGWELVPSPSPMRLATYHMPAVGNATSAELTVTRAGGGTVANVDRWVSQFDGSERETRTERTVAGYRIATVTVSGTYEGGMTGGEAETPRAGWSLLGAVVETGGPSYFFKLLGPTESVAAARPGFEKLMMSLHKPG